MLLRAFASGRHGGDTARRRTGPGRALVLAAPLLLASLPAAAPAAAQDADLRSLADQVQRLQREMADLQSTVYNGAPPPAGSGTSGSSNLDASQEVRLQQLQGEMSGLTGRIEELGYQMQRLQERVDVLANAVGEIMRGGQTGAQPGAEPGGAASATPMADAGSTAAAPAPGAASPGAASAGTASAGTATPPAAPGTLGTLTQDQLEAAQNGMAGDMTGGAMGDATGGASQPLTAPQTAATSAPAAPATPYVLPGNTPDEQYQYAFGLLRQANYAEAERALTAFIERNPASPLAGNAQYWLGETHYVRGDYQKAAVAFAAGYKNYPDSGKAPDNLLKLGMSLGEIGAKKDACTALNQLDKEFPGAPANIKERAAVERQRLGC